MPTTGAHGIIIPDPSTANATVNQVRDLAIQTEAGLSDVEAAVVAVIDLDSYATKTYVEDALSGIGTSGSLIIATGSTTIPAGSKDGDLVGYRNSSGSTITVQGVSLTSGEWAVWGWFGGAWVLLNKAGSSGGIDDTDPVPGTLTPSAITDKSFTLTVTGASDETTLHAQPYAFSTNNGSTWSAWQASAVYSATGRTPETTYQCRHKVRDGAGNEATGATVVVTTLATPPGLPVNDTFTAPDSTHVVGRTVSGFTWALDANNDLNANATGSPRIIDNVARSAAGNVAAILDVADTTVRVSADVSVSEGAGGGGGVRLGLGGARTSGGNLNGLYVIIEQTGTKAYWDNGTGSIKQVGATYNTGVGPGQTKTVSVEYSSGTVTVKVDGATATTGAVTLTGTRVGFAISLPTAGFFAVDNFKVEDV